LAALAAFGAASLIATLAPAAAYAAEYTVNSTGDQADQTVGSSGCRTIVETCTLRAAIEESNASIGATDTIKFASSFDGEIADTIELGSSLPTVTDSVRIGGLPLVPCETDYFGLSGPCVGIDGPAAGTALRVAAKEVVLNNLAISGAKTAIGSVSAPGMRLYNNWFGLKLDGNAGAIDTGVLLDQGSNGATVGGIGSETRNVFANIAAVGVEIDGADAAVVRGNGFGVMPDGATLAPNGTNIKIADAATGDNRVARGNWIGRTLEEEELGSPICDGGCNVIAGANGAGIDLAGNGANEGPATGSTRIFGNYIGLNAFGSTGVSNALQGVLVGSAENVTIGGPRAGDRNLIGGGASGVLAGPNAGNLNIEGNWIGLGATGMTMLNPPTATGIAVEGGNQVTISENRISMATGTAIEAADGEPVIRFNAIGRGVNGEGLPGGSIGIHLTESCFRCALHDNAVANATHTGVLVEGSSNRVYGNYIGGAGAAGIEIREPAFFEVVTRNVIGGDTAAEENTISMNGGAAIEINQTGAVGLNTRNAVARNHGELNGGPFIDLIGGANGEIAPPTFTSLTQFGARGNAALPGATVRVFRKASSSPGELEGFLAEATADEAGGWEVTYPVSLPSGTVVAATQTRLIDDAATPGPPDGTSELAFATTPAEPEAPATGGGANGRVPDGGGPPIPQQAAADTTPPRAIIVTRPSRRSRSPVAKFVFSSSEPGSHFRCKLDRTKLNPCRSPRTYKGLKPRWHIFRVWAIDPAGNETRSPAKWRFQILRNKTYARRVGADPDFRPWGWLAGMTCPTMRSEALFGWAGTSLLRSCWHWATP
jgi:CSLREA domain-containing protein